MNRIDELFDRKPSGVLSIYLTAGYPGPEDTVPVLKKLQESGVDLVEIGMPFSDPLADGPSLQKCNQQALDNGMSLEVLFDQLRGIRIHISIPLILMGYINPVLSYGFERFCQKAKETGIDGLILPDLPVEEYEKHYRQTCEKYGLHMIFLITPQTTDERIMHISRLSSGFIYMVSSASTTGARQGFEQEQVDYFKRIGQMGIPLPKMIGFGISNAETFRAACSYANGAIIGSAFMNHLGTSASPEKTIPQFISSILKS